MEPFSMVIAVVAISCGAGVLITFIDKVIAPRKSGAAKEVKALAEQVQALRDEVKQLRQEHHDVMLSLDTSLEHSHRRLSNLEQRAGLPGGEQLEARVR